ncbi:alpha/beta-hydrolase [Dendrothele bispora CBS 962.96]|uniref:Alpha/beta-hydrolase n=1 Tax=Dendrothele bispora (strain CBS 962.96) TaxID=1314807 RepID=A0A4S8LQ80_DENBC|nr:alpha/beta-hydrolase [Dendrothele bispora CBS 962.96]
MSPSNSNAISSKFVPSSDGSLIYAEAVGDPNKPALVLVPGYTLSTQVFDKQFDDEEMRKELFLIRYDPRGHGQSAKPEKEEGHTSKLYADDFAVVCKAFGVRKPVFAGWSLAAVILADICTHLGPDAISGGILLAGIPALTPAGFTVVPPEVLTLVPGIQSEDTALHKKAIIDFANATLFANPESVPFSVRCAWMGSAMFMSPTVMKLVVNRVQSMKELDEAGKTGKLKLLCINGEKDAHTSGKPPRDNAQ